MELTIPADKPLPNCRRDLRFPHFTEFTEAGVKRTALQPERGENAIKKGYNRPLA